MLSTIYHSTCCLFYGPRIPKSASSLLSTTRDEVSRDEASRDEENEDEESTPVISSLTSPIEEGLPTAPLQEPGGESKLAIYAPMIYTAPCIKFWMRAYPLREQVGAEQYKVKEIPTEKLNAMEVSMNWIL